MKELTRIKLINWHYFTNETIDIKGSVLFTGDNGSGKSTILDAVQYVLVANLNRIRFNVSAHEETRRNLLGYVRCKTGSDTETGVRYLRQGDVTSVVALEFYDNVKKKYFIVGVAADIRENDSQADSRFFKIEEARLEDKLFTADRKVHGARTLKARWAGLKADVYPTVESYQKALTHKLGMLGDRFFTLFVKAISFKPIVDLRKFVYDYVLDEKAINIEAMQENFRRYREYAELARVTRAKLTYLEKIFSLGGQLKNEREKILVQEYIIRRGYYEETRQELESIRKAHRDTELALELTEQRIQDLQRAIEEGESLVTELQINLSKNEEYLAYQSLEQNLREQEAKLAETSKHVGMLRRMSRVENEALNQVQEMFPSVLGADERAALEEGCSVFQLMAEGLAPEDEGKVLSILIRTQEVQKSLENSMRQELYALEAKLKAVGQEEEQVRTELQHLREKKLVYRPEVTALKELLLQKLGPRGCKPQVLCELLEIPNEKWQDAVEGYLNTQRFDLLVEPEHFDGALKLYERYKREKRIHGVGLVNTRRMPAYLNAGERGALAEEVIAANPYAQGYVNLLLGRVMKCEREEDLKNYKRAITPTCMTYGNHTARQIDFKVYETPFIGQRAFARQIELRERRLAELAAEKQQLELARDTFSQGIKLVSGKEEGYFQVKQHLGAFRQKAELAAKIAQTRQALENFDLSGIETLQAQLRQVKDELVNLKGQHTRSIREAGQLENNLQNYQHKEETLSRQATCREQELESFIEENPEAAARGLARYPNELKARTPGQLARDFEANRKTLETKYGKLKEELVKELAGYNNAYHFGGALDPDNLSDFAAERQKLQESELPEYEERINLAKNNAEREFKESFIYKLKENIDLARAEFAKLNQALAGVQFGQDKYHFQVLPSGEYKKFYDMVMDTEQLDAGGSLFEGSFHAKHQEAMDELFDRILHQDAEQVKSSLELFTDYRTFLDYDIKIHHANGETSTYSKVCREKSGGETQTPYYVAIVASFMQLYRVRSSNDSIRLMMFDEAFNRMDGERIEACLKFIRQCGMQVIVAAPSDKCEVIAPHVSTTVVVMREGHDTWLTDYRQLQLLEETWQDAEREKFSAAR